MTIDRAALRRLAEAARDARPEVDNRNEHASPDKAWLDYFGVQNEYTQAVYNPDVALALLDALERLEAASRAVLEELDIIREHRDTKPGMFVHIDTHNDLRAAIESLGA